MLDRCRPRLPRPGTRPSDQFAITTVEAQAKSRMRLSTSSCASPFVLLWSQTGYGRRPYMDPSSVASTPFFGVEVRLLTYIRSLTTQDHNGLFARQLPIGFPASKALDFVGFCWRRFDLLAIKRLALQSSWMICLVNALQLCLHCPTFTSQPDRVDSRLRSSSLPRRSWPSCWPRRPPPRWGDGSAQSG